jgi:hypothetical protein
MHIRVSRILADPNTLSTARIRVDFNRGGSVRKIHAALSIAVIAAAFTATLPGTPAAAAGIGPTIQWASSVSNDLGRIQVSVSSDAGVTGVTAHVVAPSTGTEVAVVSAFHLSSGTAQAGVWVSNEVQLSDLGSYQLNVEATDADGGHTEADAIGTLAYFVTMSIDGLTTTPTLTYTQRNYTVSGKLIGRWPGTGATAPVSGMAIYALIPGGDFTDTITTGAKGQFSLSGPVSYTDGIGFVSTLDDPDHRYYTQGYSDLFAATVKPASTKVTVHLDRSSIMSGDPVTVSGDASWKSPDGMVPMANARISIGVCPRGADEPDRCFSGPTTTTDDSGHYSFVANPYDGDMIMVAVGSDDMFVQPVSYASAKLTILMPTSFRDFYAARDADSGQIVVGAGGFDETGYSEADTVVSVQFSNNGATGWRTVGTIDLGGNSTSSFSAQFNHDGAGYWRLTYAGVKGLLAPATTDAAFVA